MSVLSLMIPKPAFSKGEGGGGAGLGLQCGVLETRAKDDGKENLSSSLPVSTLPLPPPFSLALGLAP